MAFTNGLSDRLGELRFLHPRSPIDEVPYSGFVSPPRAQNSFFSSFQSPNNDTRGGLQRRFTTDSSKLSSVQNMSGQDPNIVKPNFSASYEKKRMQIEHVREQKRKFEAQMKLLDLQEQRLQQSTATIDLDRLAKGFGPVGLSGGPASEPTTPPDYSDAGFPTSLSRPSGFSINSVTSPPGPKNRFSTSSSQLNSSPSGTINGHHPLQKCPAKSMPGSRRNSENETQCPEGASNYRPGPACSASSSLPISVLLSRRGMDLTPSRAGRYSMPATSGSQPQHRSSVPTHSGLGPLNTTSFLFDDNDENQLSAGRQGDLTSPHTGSFLHMTPNDDDFPTLRSDRTSGILSANPAALDLANSRSPDPESWASSARSRPNHQSMPQSGLNMFRPGINSASDEQNLDFTISQARLSTQKPQRHSAGVSAGEVGESSRYEQIGTGSASSSTSRPLSLQSSYSTNDLPTVKNSTSLATSGTPSKTYAEQQLQNHNANLRRFPQGATSNRQSRDFQSGLSTADSKKDDKSTAGHSLLQASAAPFGPRMTSSVDSNALSATVLSYGSNGSAPAYGYSMQTYNTSSHAAPYQLQAYQGNYTSYPIHGGYGRLQDNQTRVVHQRRPPGGSEAARSDNIPLENYRGKLYELCKDQHGCRYLQKRLEEKSPEHTSMIFVEILPFVIELMTDPFGNYLCQKLLEYSESDQRTKLIRQAAPAMVSIALSQHGTRALQKMVEYISTPEQIDIIISALGDRVVELVQDLNGNHVILKCLHQLGSEKSQFIFDAVGRHCVIVGTQRHGCCVLQRCIDHAKGPKRAQLVAAITSNAFSLVQDAFGNYVVQHILDLDEPMFTKPLCQNFAGNVPALSKQKFSSNVIEKCLRTADLETKRSIIEEMLHANEIEKMLRDSYGNYVVQTAIDHADPDTKQRMIDIIRPILPAIKQTPHGPRIAGKIMGADGQGRLGGTSDGQTASRGSSTEPSFARAKNYSNDAIERRQFQIYGQQSLFQGTNGGPHFPHQGFPEGTGNNLVGSNLVGSNFAGSNFAGSSFPGLNGMTGIFGEVSRPGRSSVSPYGGGLEPGPGYI